jgi:predicted ATPase/DNA-binding CsgD family transcriptional regulator
MTISTHLDPPLPIWKVPAALTPLLGREQEVTALCELLARPDARLLTLVGPGGIGKTRLAMQVAAELRRHFPQGVCFVSLAPIGDSELIMPTIAQELGCRGPVEVPLGEQVKRYLQDKAILLILDNFEHLMAAAPLVEEILLACPSVTILVTSRAVLHVQGEQEYPVPPLALPHLNQVAEGDDLSRYAAINLFLHRARAVSPTFEMTADNRRTIAKICIRLDGLPLAIELAAAKVKVLPSQALFARLSQRLLVLTGGGPRTAPARQQTLRNTLQWSYDLLAPGEQALFRVLAVFTGGCSLEAAEAVYRLVHGQESDCFPMITSLVDQSLVQQTAREKEEPRLMLLETIREYGLECLQTSGELKRVQQAHAEYYLAFAEQGERHLCPRAVKDGGQQLLWLGRLKQEQENLRTALLWLLQHKEAESALRLCLATVQYFYRSVGNWEELLDWHEMALALPGAHQHQACYAEVLGWKATLSLIVNRMKGKMVSSELAQLEESVALLREVGEKRRLIMALAFLGRAYQMVSHDEARATLAFEEGIALGRELEDTWRLGVPIVWLARLFEEQGELERARALLEEVVQIGQQINGQWALAQLCDHLASLATAQRDYIQAQLYAQEALRVARATDSKFVMLTACCRLGDLARRKPETAEASAWYTEALTIAREIGFHTAIPFALNKLGEIALLEGDTTRAAALTQQGLEVAREIGESRQECWSLILLGEIASQQGNDAQAQTYFQNSLACTPRGGGTHAVARGLLGFAQLASKAEQFWQATRLISKAEQFQQAGRQDGDAENVVNFRPEITPVERSVFEQVLATLHAQLGEAAFAAAQAEGRTMTLEHLVAGEEPPTPVPTTPLAGTADNTPALAFPSDLTRREIEVLRLIAQGLTDVQVAERLVISPRTVNYHLTSIYRKIQVSSRAAATRYALEHHLA